jgi:hypothetical protein
MNTLPTSGQTVQPTPDSSASSFYNLLLLMPHLPVASMAEVDYAAANPALLVQIADAADASLLIVHIGTSAIGRLLAQAEAEPFSDARSIDAIAALGWLVTELNDLAGAVHRISAACRRHTYDYVPDTVTTIPLVRP